MSEKKITHTEHYRDSWGRPQTRTWTTKVPEPLSGQEIMSLLFMGIIFSVVLVLYKVYEWGTAHLLWTGSAVVVVLVLFATYRLIRGIRLEDDWYLYPLYWASDGIGFIKSWIGW
jgi:hypothetical protein